MIPVKKITELHTAKVVQWHNKMALTESVLPWNFIEENHQWNFSLWHEEDIARIKDIDPLRIVEAKRNIDKYNQARNNAMERIDEWVLNYIQANGIESENNHLHSETPGMMIDRLSIMSLKRYHMYEETTRDNASMDHKTLCKEKVILLDAQIQDLSECLNHIFEKLELGQIHFKVYRQLKMYNDPSLNPQLYNQTK